MFERRFIKASLRASQGDEGSMMVSGYAAVFNSLSENLGGFRERLAPGCFTRTLQDAKTDCRCLINHDPSLLLGRQKNGTLSLREDATGLFFRCAVAPTSYGRDLFALVKRGDLSSCSFAFTADDQDWSETDDDDTGERMPLRTIRACSLVDCSIVHTPAYPSTSVAATPGRSDEQMEWNSVRNCFPAGVPVTGFPVEVRAAILREQASSGKARAARQKLLAVCLG